MDLTSIRAKGVYPVSSHRAVLHGWRLAFDVHHFFKHEGGMGNIHPSTDPEDRVLGVVHLCHDEALERLDAVEAYGVGYDRIEIEVVTDTGLIKSTVYVGIPSFLDPNCLPTTRYLNILIKGALAAELDSDYIDKLRKLDVLQKQTYAPFKFPDHPDRVFTAECLLKQPHFTALSGAVFDMTGARWEHDYLKGLFGGKDMTLWHLKRLDTSNGEECIEDVIKQRFNPSQKTYLNEYLHEYNKEYNFAGVFQYSN